MTAASGRAQVGTVVAVVDDDGHEEAVSVLAALGRSAAVRTILISLGDRCDAPREEHEGVVVFRQLVARYLNNAVASLRLSSLPAAAWWRAGDIDTLKELSVLVDRLVLDVPHPEPYWAQIPVLATHASVGDLRWARLTRWRDLLAQFFDQPELRRAAVPFRTAELTGADASSLALFAGWMRARMPGGRQLQVATQRGDAAIEKVQLRGAAGCATLSLLPEKSCLQTSLERGDERAVSRIVPAGDPGLDALLRQELRIRSRDRAFEEAAHQAVSI